MIPVCWQRPKRRGWAPVEHRPSPVPQALWGVDLGHANAPELLHSLFGRVRALALASTVNTSALLSSICCFLIAAEGPDAVVTAAVL